MLPKGDKLLRNNLHDKGFCLQAVQISQASPAWQDYIDYIDAIVLDGLKQSTLASLRTMLNTLVHANLMEVGSLQTI